MIHFFRAKRLHARNLTELETHAVSAYITDDDSSLYLWFETKNKRTGYKFSADQAAELIAEIAKNIQPISNRSYYTSPEDALDVQGMTLFDYSNRNS